MERLTSCQHPLIPILKQITIPLYPMMRGPRIKVQLCTGVDEGELADDCDCGHVRLLGCSTSGAFHFASSLADHLNTNHNRKECQQLFLFIFIQPAHPDSMRPTAPSSRTHIHASIFRARDPARIHTRRRPHLEDLSHAHVTHAYTRAFTILQFWGQCHTIGACNSKARRFPEPQRLRRS